MSANKFDESSPLPQILYSLVRQHASLGADPEILSTGICDCNWKDRRFARALCAVRLWASKWWRHLLLLQPNIPSCMKSLRIPCTATLVRMSASSQFSKEGVEQNIVGISRDARIQGILHGELIQDLHICSLSSLHLAGGHVDQRECLTPQLEPSTANHAINTSPWSNAQLCERSPRGQKHPEAATDVHNDVHVPIQFNLMPSSYATQHSR